MAEHINNIKVKAGTEKNFGLVFGIVFFILSCIPLLYQKNINTYLLFTGIIFFAIAIQVFLFTRFANFLSIIPSFS